jgi:hypothetical protein
MQLLVAEHVASSHWLNAVAVPGTLQAPPPGHCEVALHGAPLFVPPEQRVPAVPPQRPASVLQKPPLQTPLLHCPASVHGRPLQAPPGHSEATVHGLPPFVPPTQRPESGQSAFAPHGFALMLFHVSQKHLPVVNPTARHGGLAVVPLPATSVFVLEPVELVRSIGKVARTPPDAGGQSRLVLAQKRLGDVPLTSHVWPRF